LGDLDILGNAFFTSLGLGANYYFTETDIAPYIGADFGGGVAKSAADGIFSGQVNGGFVVGVGAGVELLRTASVNLDVGFRAGFLLNPNTYGTPQVFTLRLGLYF
jgi:hypothetical protein